MTDTIFAVSSGMPPAAIAVLRISGPNAADAMQALVGAAVAPRRASLRALRHPSTGEVLDRALVLWFPGPDTATGEDLLEFHAHGGRAVVRALEACLVTLPGLRRAQPGEFTRRAFDNGRIDLIEAEGLADLLSAETEWQRRQALALAGGHVSAAVGDWSRRLLGASAQIEAVLDFSDEEDVDAEEAVRARVAGDIAALEQEWRAWLARPSAEMVHDGVKVAIAGPPNSGKSTLINALAGRSVAITSPIAGTTRDVVEAHLALEGMAFRFADTAGLHEPSDDSIEAEGMERARQWIAAADIVLWLGPVDEAPRRGGVVTIASKVDEPESLGAAERTRADVAISARTGEGMEQLHDAIVALARQCLPGEGEVALNARQSEGLAAALQALAVGGDGAWQDGDLLLIGERLRQARIALDRLTGQSGTEAMLDALFGRFCIGK